MKQPFIYKRKPSLVNNPILTLEYNLPTLGTATALTPQLLKSTANTANLLEASTVSIILKI